KSFQDFVTLAQTCRDKVQYARSYRKRKEAFASYAETNANIDAKLSPLNAATVSIYRNAMQTELDEIVRFFYVFMANEGEMGNPWDLINRYADKGFPGCSVCLMLLALTSLL